MTLCGFGKSVFSSAISMKELVALRHQLDRILPDEDNLRIYPICKSCQAGVDWQCATG